MDAKRIRFVALGAVVVAAILFVGNRVLPSHALDPGGSGVGVTRPVGTQVSFGTYLQVKGPLSVHLISAHLTGLPDGLHAVSVMAVRFSESGFIGGRDDRPGSGIPMPPLHPVAGVVVAPGSNPGWYLLSTVRVTKPGLFVIHGPEFSYRSGGRNGVVQMANTLTVDAV